MKVDMPSNPSIKPQFLTPLIVQDDNGEMMTLHCALEYLSAIAGRIEVPDGFVTDFASIPRFFTRLIPKNGLYDRAAVVHDWLYSTQTIPKETADLVFYEAMTVLGVPAWKAWTMYQAVKWFGKGAWREHAIENAKKAAVSAIKVSAVLFLLTGCTITKVEFPGGGRLDRYSVGSRTSIPVLKFPTAAGPAELRGYSNDQTEALGLVAEKAAEGAVRAFVPSPAPILPK